MEPECAIGMPASVDTNPQGSSETSEFSIHILSQSQGVYDDQIQIAKLLGLPLEAVRVTLVPNGGGFGGKEDLSVQGHAAVMAYLTGDR
jgi:aldehyde oxidoreductase